HIVPPWLKDRRSDYLGRDACFDLLYGNPKARLATADDLVASMEEAGVDVSVALNIGWSDRELCIATNDYILEAAARFQHRLAAFCAVPLGAGEVALREMERCAAAGAQGIGELRPEPGAGGAVDAGLMAELGALARERHLILLFHSSEPLGHGYPGKGSTRPEVLYALVAALPGVNVVCAHWGGGLPFYSLMPEVGEVVKGVYYDTAATRYLYRAAIYPRVVELVGAERILMGSDYPLIPQERHVQEIVSADVAEKAKSMMLGGNARALLFGARG
ncbi:MAG: amidohydrolase family protein, partial [Chloroflexi bacterium]|nr:amidohydrolase family protein [Chloroflexota bacterium]